MGTLVNRVFIHKSTKGRKKQENNPQRPLQTSTRKKSREFCSRDFFFLARPQMPHALRDWLKRKKPGQRRQAMSGISFLLVHPLPDHAQRNPSAPRTHYTSGFCQHPTPAKRHCLQTITTQKSQENKAQPAHHAVMKGHNLLNLISYRSPYPSPRVVVTSLTSQINSI